MSIHDAAIDLGRRFDIFQRDRHPETR
jgi:hypothetical protein